MPWTEILASDAAGIGKFSTFQQQITPFYRDNFSVGYLTRLFEYKREFRSFFYEDATHKISLSTARRRDSSIVLLTGGLLTTGLVRPAATIFISKVFAVMTEYGTKTFWAKIPQDTLNNNLAFFTDIFVRFAASGLTNPFVISTRNAEWKVVTVTLP